MNLQSDLSCKGIRSNLITVICHWSLKTVRWALLGFQPPGLQYMEMAWIVPQRHVNLMSWNVSLRNSLQCLCQSFIIYCHITLTVVHGAFESTKKKCPNLTCSEEILYPCVASLCFQFVSTAFLKIDWNITLRFLHDFSLYYGSHMSFLKHFLFSIGLFSSCLSCWTSVAGS